jgi:hypothetical protein
MKTKTKRDRDLLASEAVHCNRCGKEVRPRSVRAGSAVCAKCRAAAGQVFYRNRGEDIPPRPIAVPDPPKSGPIWTLTDEQIEAAQARRDEMTRALQSGRREAIPQRKPARRVPKAPRDLKIRAAGVERALRRVARGLPALTREEQAVEAAVHADIARAIRRRRWSRLTRPAGVTPYQWEALRLIEVERLSLAEAGQRMKPPVSKQAVAKVLSKVRQKVTRGVDDLASSAL